MPKLVPNTPIVALLFTLGIATHQGSPLHRILGRWRGTSTCVRAAWNAACNDEQVIYDFVAGPDSTRVLLHAAKLVDGQPDPMGDLDLRYDPVTNAWDGDFANTRVRIRWTYRIVGDSLVGQLITLPSKQVARHVVARRSESGR